ncbi:exonuclease SbcCD subunit D [Sporomusa aerivorans]|uniref:metallophosphoesterase family protein n=1 Tax=Sporomusa aerivorans TaxID=204936 RepID=UPI00352A972B
MKFLFVGDLHLRGTNPRNRIDDYKEAVKAKLREVFSLAEQHEIKAILCPGDIWDRPEVSIGVLVEFMQVFRECPVDFYTCAGNHDIHGYNLDTYDRTSLRLLAELVPKFRVFSESQVMVYPDVAITFGPYSGRIDREGHGYDTHWKDEQFKIHITHGMLLDHTPPFDRFTLIQDVKTTADLVLTGHDHHGFGIYRRSDGKVFCNPGSLTRISASTGEIERPIQVALIDVLDKQTFDIQLIPLQSAKPGSEVLDRSKIEAEKQRQYAMEEFAALIQTGSGEKVLLNINDIVESIAAKESLAPDVVKKTLEKIQEQRLGAA